jgi:hypothetical protein
MSTAAKFLTAVVVFLGLFPCFARADEPHPCEWLLRYGIYDTEEVAIDRYTLEHMRSLLKYLKAESVRNFEKEASAFQDCST